jgi:hypothetical protein
MKPPIIGPRTGPFMGARQKRLNAKVRWSSLNISPIEPGAFEIVTEPTKALEWINQISPWPSDKRRSPSQTHAKNRTMRIVRKLSAKQDAKTNIENRNNETMYTGLRP